MRFYHYDAHHYHAYFNKARLDLESFAFVPLTSAAGFKKILRSYYYHADDYNARLDLGNFAFVPLPRAAGLKNILCS